MSTAEDIMDVALEMVQKRGYHAFSYRDLSERVGIKTASIHYYFPTKAALGQSLLSRVRMMFEQALLQIDSEGGDASSKLRKFAGIFLDTYGEGSICPFCMIATCQDSIPDYVQDEVKAFWLKGEEWVANLLAEGVSNGEIKLVDTPQQTARTLVSSLEGSIVVARAFDDKSRLEKTIDYLLLPLKQ